MTAIFESLPSSSGKRTRRHDLLSQSAPLPSLSCLTGNVRPGTAAAFIEQSFHQLKNANRRLMTPHLGSGGRTASSNRVDDLANAAAQHLNAMDKVSSNPYQRVLSPAERTRMEEEVTKRIKSMADYLRAQQQQHSSQDHNAQASSPETDSAGVHAPASAGGRLATPALLPGTSRPGTSSSTAAISPSDLALPRPGKGTSRFSNLPGTQMLSASWSGASGAAHWHGLEARLGLTTAEPLPNKPSTPMRGHLLRQSAPAPLAPSRLGAGGSQESATATGNPLAASSPGMRLPTPSIAAQQAANEALMRSLLQSSGRLSTPQLGSGGRRMQPTSTAGEFTARFGTHASGVEPCLSNFKVTPGMMYSVFTDLDAFATGKIVYSVMEDAGYRVGMRAEQTRKLFNMLDCDGKGYVTLKDWGNKGIDKPIRAFTRMYVQATRGSSGKAKDVREIQSMHMAVQMAMAKLQLKNHGRSVNFDRVVEAFKFIDADASGELDSQEIEDAFNALGLFVTKDVVDTVMKTFDKDGSGTVAYVEFVTALFPTLAQGSG